MPTETGHGNSAEIHFLPTTSEFLFNSASRATGAVHGGTEQHSWGSCNAHFVRRCPARCFSYVATATLPSVIRSISFVIAVSLAAASCSSSSETSTVQESLATSTTVAQATTTAPPTVTTTTLAPPTTAEATTTTTEPEAAFLSRWMGDLPDSQRLTELAIPGSHDSTATIDYKFGELVIADTAKTQNLTIDEQLRVGTRFLDIRLLQEQGILETYHGIVKQEMPFSKFWKAPTASWRNSRQRSLSCRSRRKAQRSDPSKCRSLSRLKQSSPRTQSVGTSPTQLRRSATREEKSSL